jgi:hypothetical protein
VNLHVIVDLAMNLKTAALQDFVNILLRRENQRFLRRTYGAYDRVVVFAPAPTPEEGTKE